MRCVHLQSSLNGSEEYFENLSNLYTWLADLANRKWVIFTFIIFSKSCLRNRCSAQNIILFVKSVAHWFIELIRYLFIHDIFFTSILCSARELTVKVERVRGWALSWPAPDLRLSGVMHRYISWDRFLSSWDKYCV